MLELCAQVRIDNMYIV